VVGLPSAPGKVHGQMMGGHHRLDFVLGVNTLNSRERTIHCTFAYRRIGIAMSRVDQLNQLLLHKSGLSCAKGLMEGNIANAMLGMIRLNLDRLRWLVL